MSTQLQSFLEEDNTQPFGVFDIGGSVLAFDLLQDLEEALENRSYIGKLVYYQQTGWAAISEESRQTIDECNILESNDYLIASRICEKDTVNRTCEIIELGPGDFKKTEILLEALYRLSCKVLYIAVDINVENLQRNIPSLDSRWRGVECFGLWGSFDQALAKFEQHDYEPHSNRWILSLGSSLSNDNKATVINRIERWSQFAEGFILGQDGTTDESKVLQPYESHEFREFIDRGLLSADAQLQQSVFAGQWDLQSKLLQCPIRHVFILEAHSNIDFVTSNGTRVEMKKGEQIETFASFKYGQEDLEEMVHMAGCTLERSLKSTESGTSNSESGIYVVTKTLQDVVSEGYVMVRNHKRDRSLSA